MMTANSWLCALLVSVIVAYTTASKCSVCKDVVRKFNEGIEKTHKSNFGGGNTRWEEKSLGSFQYSETRYIEIFESVCKRAMYGAQCHSFVEQYEETIEDWWFKHYAKKIDTDLQKYLCVDKAVACCADGTYGPICLECKGGKDNPCRGQGSCDGQGTREGTGKCSCYSGYTGESCENCADKYYEESRSDTQTVCKACHKSCGSGCEGSETGDCHDCASGYDEEEEGCFDINECAADQNPCKENQYCENTDGSYDCKTCHASCASCTGGTSKDCKECSPRYYKDLESETCKECHVACASSCVDGTPATCDECKAGFVSGDEGCQDVDECADGTGSCDDNEYCQNSEGSFKCVTCHPYCSGCSGPGANKCTACKSGYKVDDKGFCKDVDECAVDDDDDAPCRGPGTKCVNLPGGHRCDCTDGFVKKDDKCVPKPKENQKEKKTSKAYKGPAKCDTCKDIVKNINEGMKKTEKTNFGGGNTRWEEKKLGKYMYSETRFIEIFDQACGDDDQSVNYTYCHDLIEKFEHELEKWWFDIYGKGEEVDLNSWFCVERAMICCPEGTYGSQCKACPGGSDNACSGNGKCAGDGTRKGSGACKCDKGYTGTKCDACAPLNYTSYQDDKRIECKGCDEACLTACFEGGPGGCEDCKEGWKFETEKGCVDINECEGDICESDQFCSNTPGSYSCQACDDACEEACTGQGPGNCVKCGNDYFQDENGECKACHKSCRDGCKDASPQSCESCKSGWERHEVAGCMDIDECRDGSAECKDDEYCDNSPGTFSCKKCYPSCKKCHGPGPGLCEECNVGYKKNSANVCVDINECEEQTGVCGAGKKCSNTPGSFTCECEGDDMVEDDDGSCVRKADRERIGDIHTQNGKKKRDEF